MLVVAASEAEIAAVLAGREAEVSLAGVNAARQVTVSGARGAITAIAAACAARGWRSQLLPVSQAFHSPLMEPMAAAFEVRAGELAYAAARVPVISNLTGAPVERVNAGYWRAHMRQAVRFSQGLETLLGLGCDVLLEVGPRPVLLQLARQAAGGQGGRRYLTSLKGPGTDDWDALCLAVQELYAAGAEIDWSGWHRDYRRRKVDAPLYPFERRRYWLSPSARAPGSSRDRADGHGLLGTRMRSALGMGQFDAELTATGETAWLAEHRLGGQAIVPATGLIEMMLAAGEAMDPRWRAVEGLSIFAPLCLPGRGTRTVQTVVDVPQDERARVRVFAAEADDAGIEAAPDAEGQLRYRLHAEARLAPAEPPADQVASDLAGLRTRCRRAVDGQAHYGQLLARGADFGPAFQGVRQLWVGEDEALGEVDVLLAPMAGSRPHPATLDGCLQVAAGVLTENTSDTFVPVVLERFEGVATSWPQHLLVHARLAHPDRVRPQFDFTILDRAGTTLARFRGLQFHNKTTASAAKPFQSWLYELGWRPLPVLGSAERLAEWVVAGSGGIAQALVDRLRDAGQRVTPCPVLAGEVEGVLARKVHRGIVYVPPEPDGDLSELGPMCAQSGVEALLGLCHRHVADALLANSRLYVVTRRVHAVRPSEATLLPDAAISGLAASIANEFPELRCSRIDVDPSSEAEAGRDIAQEVLADAADDWVAYRDGRRFVARLRRPPPVSRSGLDDGPIRLVCERGLEGLNWRSMPRPQLAPEEVEIEVHAAALNFRDVMVAVGLVPDPRSLGSECAGVVTRVGPAVKRFHAGDAVVAITPGCFATLAVAPEHRILAKAPSLSFETASAQSLVYLTADYCLTALARMRPGERVLIHAAAGGVGLAAVQLCRQAGVEIYATAGSDDKRAYLRQLGVEHVFSSRSTAFAEQISSLTQGRGVDVVLNSLTGALIDAGLSLLGPGGRFLEIGKTDIRQQKDVAALRPDVVYQPVDLTDLLQSQPGPTMKRLGELFAAIEAGELAPVPHQTYEFDDVKTAFRHLAAASHIGKVVLRPTTTRPIVRTDGTYIVTGGAASVGFATAEWLAGQGAGRILLLSRRPPAPEITARIAFWREKGIAMDARQGDVGDRTTVDAVVADAGAGLRGIIHCANVLDDAPLGQLTWDRFEQVMRPKAQGGWHLHGATLGRELDFFVLFSSGRRLPASTIGQITPRPAWHWTRSRSSGASKKLSALSLDWGAWADIGWAARLGEAMPAWAGFDTMKPELALNAMAWAIRHARSGQLAIAPLDWARLKTTFGRNVASVFSEFVAPVEPQAGGPTRSCPSLREVIASASAGAAHSVVVAQLQVMAAAALGIEEPGHIDPEQPLQDLGLDSSWRSTSATPWHTHSANLCRQPFCSIIRRLTASRATASACSHRKSRRWFPFALGSMVMIYLSSLRD